MNCSGCTLDGRSTPAHAVCSDCEAGACMEHLVIRQHRLTRTEPLMRQVPVDPPGRRVRCISCDSAWQAAHAPAGSPTRPERRPA